MSYSVNHQIHLPFAVVSSLAGQMLPYRVPESPLELCVSVYTENSQNCEVRIVSGGLMAFG